MSTEKEVISEPTEKKRKTIKKDRAVIEELKTRYWAFILYPESAVPDWKQVLEMTGSKCAISPIHDKDWWSVDDIKKHGMEWIQQHSNETLIHEDGSTEFRKKPHYHVMIVKDNGSTTYNFVDAISNYIGGTRPEPLISPFGYYQYLTHENNKNKYHYDPLDIIKFNGFNAKELISLTQSEIDLIKNWIYCYIEDNDILYYSTLIKMLLTEGYVHEKMVVEHNSQLFSIYLRELREEQLSVLDPIQKKASEMFKKQYGKLSDRVKDILKKFEELN